MILEYKGSSIFYTDDGEGNPVVLLHGFLENSTMWNAFIPELTINNRVICIDLLGHGKTDCIGYVHTMEAMADAVEAVLKHLAVNKFKMVGHSMGGYVALAFAEKNSIQVSGLCLMNSTSYADGPERIILRNRSIDAVKTNYHNIVKMSISNLFCAKNRSLLAKKIEAVKTEALQTPLQGYIAAQEGMKLRKNRTLLLKNLDCTKMIIIGKNDPVLDYKSSKTEADDTFSRLIECPDGHMSHIENERKILKEIMYFIE